MHRKQKEMVQVVLGALVAGIVFAVVAMWVGAMAG